MTAVAKSRLKWLFALVGYYCWFQAFYNAMRFGSMFPYTDFNDFIVGVLKNFIPIFLLSLADLFIVFRLTTPVGIKWKIVFDLVLSMMATVVVNLVYFGVRYMIGYSEAFDIRIIDWAGTLLNDIIIVMGMELVYYFSSLLQSRNETETARRQALQYQYDALKSQINPHFLFNSLNILYSLVSRDADRSKLFIRELAKMYRYVMTQHNRDIVEVREELEFLDSYVSVLEIRYNNKFVVSIEGAPRGDVYLIPFTMQLLVENVTKHNVITSHQPMTVMVQIHDNGIRISNPIRYRPAESAGQMGLSYLTRLYAAHGCRFFVENDGKTFTAHIPFISKSQL